MCHCSSGLHNGYTILGGKWSKFLLREDDSDRDVLRTVDAELALAGFSPNEYMALAILVECHLGIPGAQVRLGLLLLAVSMLVMCRLLTFICRCCGECMYSGRPS